MLKNISKIYLLLLCVVFVGCRREDSRLQNADAIMEEYTDSAFNILKSINKSQLSKEDLPYYALLYTQAQIKTDVEVYSDSLISLPLAYYEVNDSKNRFVRTNFYAAFISLYRKDYADAMQKVLKAYDIAKNNNDYFWRARRAELIGDIFCATHDYNQTIPYSKETILNYRKSGNIDAERYAIADLASRYCYIGQKEKAVQILDSILRVTQKDMPNDKRLIEYLKFHISSVNTRINNARRVNLNDLKVYDRFSGESYKVLNIVTKASMEECKGVCSPETEDSLLKLKQCVKSFNSKAYLTYALYKRAKAKGDFKYAASLTDSLIRFQNVLYDSLRKESVRIVESDFYSQKAEEEHEVSIRKNHIIIGISVTAIVIVALILALFYSKLRSKKKEIESNLSMLTTMREHSMRVESENQSLVREAGKRQEEHSRIVSDLFATKWKSMNSLCDQYIALNGDNKCERMFYKNFESILNDMRTPGGLKDVEGMVNKYMDGVAMRFRDEMPGLKEYDYQLLFLTAAGFSAKTIALLLNINSQNYYLRRRRLRSRIEAEAPPHIDEFLQRLGS